MAGVAGRYASALFDLALEQGSLDVVADELQQVGAMLRNSADLRRLVRSATFRADEQGAALSALADKAGFTVLTGNFLRLLAQNRRLFALADMVVAFDRLVADHRGETAADVVSATELSEPQMDDLRSSLAVIAGKRVKLTVEVDASLLGGLVVKLGSKMIDTSIRSKLNRLKVAMKEVG